MTPKNNAYMFILPIDTYDVPKIENSTSLISSWKFTSTTFQFQVTSISKPAFLQRIRTITFWTTAKSAIFDGSASLVILFSHKFWMDAV